MKPFVQACLLLGALAAGRWAAVGQKPPAKAAAGAKYKWLVLDRLGQTHSIDVAVIGKNYTQFAQKGTGTCALPLSFEDGTNTIVATFTPRDEDQEADEDEEASSLDIYLSPTKEVGDDSLFLDGCDADDGPNVLEIQLEVKDGVPVSEKLRQRNWLDAARKKLLYEYKAESRVGSEFHDKGWEREWDEDGVPISESYSEGEKLVASRDYKPDGTVGAEVKGGNGFRREWFDDGTLSWELPYKDGLEEGTERELYDSGKVAMVRQYVHGKLQGAYLECYENGVPRVRGSYRDGEKEGVWTLYDEDGKEKERSTFKAGKRIRGTYDFEE